MRILGDIFGRCGFVIGNTLILLFVAMLGVYALLGMIWNVVWRGEAPCT